MDTKSGKVNINNNNIDKRTPLKEILPLNTPISVDFNTTNSCNLRCFFCGHSTVNKGFSKSKKTTMDFDLFKKSIDDMDEFPGKIKAIHFAGFGEPLMHKILPEMIAYAVKSNVADNVDLLTNGVLLNKKTSEKLIETKLDWIRFSINGLSSEEYKDNCGVEVNFQKLIDEIAYFHKNSTSTKVRVKILDYMVNTEERTKLFKEIFEPISDMLCIEYLCDIISVESEKIAGITTVLDIRGGKARDLQVCPLPFYLLRVNPDGTTVPCCEPRLKGHFGDVATASLYDIWNGQAFNQHRYAMLCGTRNTNNFCRKCQNYKYSASPEDYLDSHAERLKKFYS